MVLDGGGKAFEQAARAGGSALSGLGRMVTPGFYAWEATRIAKHDGMMVNTDGYITQKGADAAGLSTMMTADVMAIAGTSGFSALAGKSALTASLVGGGAKGLLLGMATRIPLYGALAYASYEVAEEGVLLDNDHQAIRNHIDHQTRAGETTRLMIRNPNYENPDDPEDVRYLDVVSRPSLLNYEQAKLSAGMFSHLIADRVEGAVIRESDGKIENLSDIDWNRPENLAAFRDMLHMALEEQRAIEAKYKPLLPDWMPSFGETFGADWGFSRLSALRPLANMDLEARGNRMDQYHQARTNVAMLESAQTEINRYNHGMIIYGQMREDLASAMEAPETPAAVQEYHDDILILEAAIAQNDLGNVTGLYSSFASDTQRLLLDGHFEPLDEDTRQNFLHVYMGMEEQIYQRLRSDMRALEIRMQNEAPEAVADDLARMDMSILQLAQAGYFTDLHPHFNRDLQAHYSDILDLAKDKGLLVSPEEDNRELAEGPEAEANGEAREAGINAVERTKAFFQNAALGGAAAAAAQAERRRRISAAGADDANDPSNRNQFNGAADQGAGRDGQAIDGPNPIERIFGDFDLSQDWKKLLPIGGGLVSSIVSMNLFKNNAFMKYGLSIAAIALGGFLTMQQLKSDADQERNTAPHPREHAPVGPGLD